MYNETQVFMRYTRVTGHRAVYTVKIKLNCAINLYHVWGKQYTSVVVGYRSGQFDKGPSFVLRLLSWFRTASDRHWCHSSEKYTKPFPPFWNVMKTKRTAERAIGTSFSLPSTYPPPSYPFCWSRAHLPNKVTLCTSSRTNWKPKPTSNPLTSVQGLNHCFLWACPKRTLYPNTQWTAAPWKKAGLDVTQSHPL